MFPNFRRKKNSPEEGDLFTRPASSVNSPSLQASPNGKKVKRRAVPPATMKGLPYDEEGRHIGDSYAYNAKINGIERQRRESHGPIKRSTEPVVPEITQANKPWIEGVDPVVELASSSSQHSLGMFTSMFEEPVTAISPLSPDIPATQKSSSIDTILLLLVQNHADLAGPEHEPREMTILRLIQRYEDLLSASSTLATSQTSPESSALRNKMLQAQGEAQAALKELRDVENKNKMLRETKDALQNRTKELKNSNERLQDKIIQMTEEYTKQDKSTKDQIQDLNSQVLRQDFQLNQSSSEHAEKIRKMQILQKRDIEAQEQAHLANLRKLQTEHNGDKIAWNQARTELDESLSDSNTRLRHLEVAVKERVRESEERWDRKLQAERMKYNDDIRSLQDEIKQLEVSHRRETTRIEAELHSQKQVLAAEHEGERLRLRNVIEDFKVATSHRDHVKGLTDSEIAGLFTRLVTKIEDFSRLEWDYSKQHQWPLSEVHMGQLSKNSRKFKQQIVQHTLWVYLWHCVFRSPFQIMGADGREDGSQWKSIYESGADSREWLEVPSDVEAVRHETAKEFLRVLESSASNDGLKKGFEESVEDAVKATCGALEKVAKVHDKTQSGIENIVRLAAKTWLESCSQKYRLMVILPDGSDDILSGEHSDSRPIKLVVRPELRRYGDSQGKALMRGEPLASWKGQTEQYGK